MIAGASVRRQPYLLHLLAIATVYAETGEKEEFLVSHCQMGFRQTMT